MMAKANGRRTVPQIFIGEMHVGGSDELHALDRQGGSIRCLPEAERVTVKTALIQMRSGRDMARNIADALADR